MWNISSEERLLKWKEFRAGLSSVPFDVAVKDTAHLWSYAPFVSHYLDHLDLQDWPSPWELISEGKFDETAKAVCMLYTLALSVHIEGHEYQLQHYVDSNLVEYYVVSIDHGKYILNYQFDEVISKEQLGENVELVASYSASDLHLLEY